MKKSVSLLSLVGEAFVFQIAAVGLLFAIHVVAARIGGSNAYGVFSYALTVAGFLSVVTTLGLANSSLRYIAGYYETGEWSLLKGLLRRAPQLILAVSIPSGLLLMLVPFFFPNSSFGSGLLAAGILLPILALGFWRSAANRGFQNIRHTVVPEEILRPLAFIALCLILYVFGKNETEFGLVGAYVLAAAASLLIGLRWLSSDIPDKCKNTTARYSTRVWLRTSFPILIAGVFQDLMTRADMLILGTLGTMEATGLYNAASRLSMLNIFPLRVVDTIIPPKIAAAFHAGNYMEIRSLVKKATLMSTIGAFPLFAIMMLFPEQLLALFGKPFIEASPYLRILACGQFVNALTGPVGFTLLMTGNERFYRNVLMTVASFSVLANLWAVPRFAALGAAWVMAASIVILNVALYLGVYKKIFALR